MSDLISATFPASDEQEVMDLIARIRAKLPFGIKLSADQRRRRPKMDDGRIPFVEKGLDFGRQQPKIVPPYTDIEELKKDLDFVKATRRVGNEMQSLFEMLTDTRMAAGSDAFQAALAIYNSAKSAVKQGVPGSQAIVDEMGKLFEGQGGASKTTDATAK